ncbi:hypothetical protein [Actinoplanes regularis]|uniref:hypothetical protein n=1 Tax=Actinoplanes regularis TaxID=52697 RepID=UPI002552F3DE|nr:hypothetical protein [Actinoplanes regularis]
MSRFGQQAVMAAGWMTAAVLAVLVGVLGIGLVGLTGRDDTMSEADVQRALTQVSSDSAPAPAPTTSRPSPAASVDAGKSSFRTRGGIVVADCDGIVSMAPARGFAVHEQNGREGEFRGVRDRHDRVKVQLTCDAGVPRVTERDED